jgi:site-specific recombinase
MLAVWAAVVVALVGLLGGLALAFVRGRRAWRRFKALRTTVGNGIDEIAVASAEIETHLTRAGEGSERLSAALERLRRSRARLDVLLAAVREARASMARAVPFLGGR